MFESSKEIMEKINNANCLTEKELRIVEVSLRMYETGNSIINESMGLSRTNIYELSHRVGVNIEIESDNEHL